MAEALKNNIFMIVLAIGYTAFIIYHYINLKKFSGEKIKEYDHNSGIKLTGYIMIFFGIFYTVLYFVDKHKDINKTVTGILFLYFVVLVAYISIRKIGFYENGIFYSGKFVKFEDMESIDRLNQKAIQIKLNGKKLTSGVYMTKVVEDNEFIGAVRKKIKANKKGKKKK